MNRRAVFLDRDGVLVRLVQNFPGETFESPLLPELVELIPGAAPAVRALANADFTLIGVTNQPAAAKGQTSLANVKAAQAKCEALLAKEGLTLDAWRVCFHHPQGCDPVLGVPCDCRKPAPDMLRSAAEQFGIDFQSSWMIGDTDADILAGQAVGCRTILVEPAASAHKRTDRVQPEFRASDLNAAAELLLSQAEPW